MIPARPQAILVLDTDYTDLPLWLDGLLERDDIALDPSTWAGLAAWADYFATYYTTSYEWRSGADPDWYRQEGDRLATQVAREIGSDYAVSHAGTVFRSRNAPTNREAAEDVQRLINDDAGFGLAPRDVGTNTSDVLWI